MSNVLHWGRRGDKFRIGIIDGKLDPVTEFGLGDKVARFHLKELRDEIDVALVNDIPEPAEPHAPLAWWRTGRKVGRTLYVGDRLVGVMDDAAMATSIVVAMNSRIAAARRANPAPAAPKPTFTPQALCTCGHAAFQHGLTPGGTRCCVAGCACEGVTFPPEPGRSAGPRWADVVDAPTPTVTLFERVARLEAFVEELRRGLAQPSTTIAKRLDDALDAAIDAYDKHKPETADDDEEDSDA